MAWVGGRSSPRMSGLNILQMQGQFHIAVFCVPTCHSSNHTGGWLPMRSS